MGLKGNISTIKSIAVTILYNNNFNSFNYNDDNYNKNIKQTKL